MSLEDARRMPAIANGPLQPGRETLGGRGPCLCLTEQVPLGGGWYPPSSSPNTPPPRPSPSPCPPPTTQPTEPRTYTTTCPSTHSSSTHPPRCNRLPGYFPGKGHREAQAAQGTPPTHQPSSPMGVVIAGWVGRVVRLLHLQGGGGWGGIGLGLGTRHCQWDTQNSGAAVRVENGWVCCVQKKSERGRERQRGEKRQSE